jgi:hypothetical protein
MQIYERLLSLGLVLGLVAGLGWSIGPPANGIAVQLPARIFPSPAATSPPALPQFQIATLTPTRTPTPINIGNFVWNDLNGNGVQGAGEPGLPGITVQLWNAAKTDLIDSATTNSNGNYTVTAPVPGNYRIRVVLPGAGYTFTLMDQGGDNQLDSDINPSGADAGFTDIFNLASNVISTTIMDAGIRPPPGSPTPTRTPTPINIGNFVWNDLDGDGIQDTGEPGLNGITVQLWNAAKTQLIDSAVTNASGIYAVTAPVPGDYRIRVVLPGAGYIFTLKDQGGDDLKDSDINWIGSDTGFSDIFNLASNVISITTKDAGIRPPPGSPTPTRTPTPINIGNFVWNDLNGNGIQDSGEPGLNGITVQLWNAAKTQLIDSAVTSASGIYALTAPLPGDYRIRVLAPTGAIFTLKDQGGDDTGDSDINWIGDDAGFSDVFNLASNVISITKMDAGLRNVPATPTMTATATPGPEANKAFLPILVK